MTYQAVIVGAGPAGIAAACRLLAKGVDKILLLEAEDRIGGRIHTVPFGDGVVDLGAQFCHGEKGNVVYEMAHPLNLLESSKTLYTNMAFVDSGGQFVDKGAAAWLLGMCLAITDEAGKDLKSYPHSLGDYITSEFYKRINGDAAPENLPKSLSDNFLEWFHRFENSIDGSDSWFETSGSGHTEYVECDGDPVLVWKHGGYKTVLDLLMKKIPNASLGLPLESKVMLKKEVLNVTWDHVREGGPVVVVCRDGSEYHADRAIITVSLGVLKEQAHSLFSPPLPKIKLNAIHGLSIGAVNKIFLKFSDNWWPAETHGFSLIWTQTDSDKFREKYGNNKKKSWIREVFGFYKDLGQPGVLCGWIVGPEARTMEMCSDEEVIEGCEELLKKFVGNKYSVPRIEAVARSYWFTNPHFRGSYSFRSMKTEQMGVNAKQLAEPVQNSNQKSVLHFAGEATHEYFFSTVHGAIETGWREADLVLESISGNRKCSL
ncbi:spermine oxidase [Thrips palmi]|uniref:Spermine oxidase n=1 Tax=Thrips palmi TaxID=161013 RepID=A0A6P8YGV6_THRPL|nr:spermine oxidase [Thrips palmi]